jgi:hypothetical protein
MSTTPAKQSKTYPLWRALWPAIFLSVLVAASAWLMQKKILPPAQLITQVEASPAELPASWVVWNEPLRPDWRAVNLPVNSCKVRCRTPYTSWRYRFDWDGASQRDLAVYFPHTDSNIAVYLNGSLLEMRGRMEAPPSVFRYTPRLIRLPQGLLHQGQNDLTWRLTIERPGLGQMHGFYLADMAQLQPAYRNLHLLTYDLILGSFWLQIGVWLVALIMILRGKAEPVLNWYMLASPSWLIIAAMHLFPSIMHTVSGRSNTYFGAFFMMVAFSPLFVTSLLEKPSRWLSVSAWIYFAVGLTLTLICNALEWPANTIMYGLPNKFLKYSALLILPFIIWRLFRYLQFNRTSRLARWIFAAALLTAICGVHDVLRTGAVAAHYVFVPLAGIGISAALCMELGRRTLESAQKLARYSEDLAYTVRAREAVLNVQYAKLRLADQERMLSDERSRIMRDMHDGVGGQLAVLVHMADDPNVGRTEIVEAVRTGLADMRLVLDSLNHAGGDLLARSRSACRRC